MNTRSTCVWPIALVFAALAAVPAHAEPKKLERDANGKLIDHCRQSGAMGTRLANYRLLGKPLDELIADVRISGVEEAPTPKIELMAAEVYALRLAPAEAFERYQKACPFRD